MEWWVAMHILMIAPEQIPVPGNGSVEICMLSIAKQLAKYHKVTIVSRMSGNYPKRSEMGNLTIIRVPSGGSKRYISSVLRYITGKTYDFIQVDNRPHYMAKVKARFPKVPVSLFLHSLTFVPQTRSVLQSMESADLIVANSHSLKANLSRMFPKIKHKIRMVHLGVDLARFKPLSESEKQRLKNKYKLGKGFTILFAGRVIPRKGVPIVIRAASILRKQIPNARLVIVGGGKQAYIKSLKALTTRLHVPSLFTGRVSHRKIHQLFGMSDCFVCPSQKHEAFGLVNVEALAAGLPVVASNIGGIKEIIKPGMNGYLVDRYKSPEQFAYFLSKLGSNRDLAKRLSLQGRNDVVRRFGWSVTAAKLNRIYTAKAKA